MGRAYHRLKLRLTFLALSLGFKVGTLKELEKWVAFGLISGIIGGVAALAFTTLLAILENLFNILRNLHPYGLVASLGLGGLLSGLIVYTVAPEAEGHGTDAVTRAIHRKWSMMRFRTGLVKMVASALTIGSGGSAGKEGPIAQITASFASTLASLLRLDVRDRRMLVVSSIAAGIGAIFKAPLGAAMFAVEVLYRRDLEVDAIVPSIMGSVIAHSIYCSAVGWEPLLSHPEYAYRNPVELALFLLLGLIVGVTGMFYVRLFYGIHRAFKLLKLPPHFKPFIGALALGLISLGYPQILGPGYELMADALEGECPWELMGILALLKMVATGLTIGSGGSGGVYAPSLYIGAMIGGTLGGLFASLFPDVVSQPSAYALIGMASFFSGAAKVPLSAIIMVVEITGGYTFLVPALTASAVSYVITGDLSIYREQISRREV